MTPNGKRLNALPQRLTMVTLGVRDMARSRAFYQALGFARADFASETVTFFDMNGVVLGLYAHDALAADANVPPGDPPAPGTADGFRGVTMSINMESPAAVDEALNFSIACGASLPKPAEKTHWGGYSGYFADPDGHLWEIAYNPHAPLDDNGHMPLPPPVARQS